MNATTLSLLQIDFVIAKIIGHKVIRRRGDYVEIQDWGKPGSKVNGCRFEPTRDKVHNAEMTALFEIKAHRNADATWNACLPAYSKTFPTHEIWAGCVYGQPSYEEATMRAIVCAQYPGDIPSKVLEGFEND